MKSIFIAAIAIILASTIVLGANGYAYTQGVEPHVRYNNLRNDCYYYYGYGSCNVTKTQCDGVKIGEDKWIDLGDACKRNEPPKIKPGTLKDITVNEGQKITIVAECIDEDPVKITYRGLSDQKTKVLSYDDAGVRRVIVTCTDSFGETVEGSIKITVNDVNRKPLFKLIDWEITPPKANFTINSTNSK